MTSAANKNPGFHFSAKSIAELKTCHFKLRMLFYEVIKHYDCSIIQGHRGQQEQDEYFRIGFSKLKFPKGKHNKILSLAVDAGPYNPYIRGIDWNDRDSFYHFAGFVRGVAAQMGFNIRWGGDWDSDKDLHDQTFMDLVHFELVK